MPYSKRVYELGAVLFAFFIVLWFCSRLSPLVYLSGFCSSCHVGIFLIGFQILCEEQILRHLSSNRNPAVRDRDLRGVGLSSPRSSWVKFIVSVSFIILLSSTTKMQDLLEASGRLGLPREFILPLGMMVRYILSLPRTFGKIRSAMDARCFDPFDRNLPYRYRLRQLGYTIGMFFIRSYEQGERTYTSMLCRGLVGKGRTCIYDPDPSSRRSVFLCRRARLHSCSPRS